MDDLINVGSMLLVVSPVIVGFAMFAGLWLRDNFYTKPFYDDYED